MQLMVQCSLCCASQAPPHCCCSAFPLKLRGSQNVTEAALMQKSGLGILLRWSSLSLVTQPPAQDSSASELGGEAGGKHLSLCRLADFAGCLYGCGKGSPQLHVNMPQLQSSDPLWVIFHF